MAPRASTIKKHLEDGSIRLSAADRAFLDDLAKVRIVDVQDAESTHYQGRKTGAQKRLDKLVKAGLLEAHNVYQPAKGQVRAYSFANDKIASVFGGKTPTIGKKRNALHEIITSKIYFAEGRPKSFLLEGDFDQSFKSFFKELAVDNGITDQKGIIPDAVFKDANGALVIVEADSGQYSKAQIEAKQAAWAGTKQVWGQPAKSFSRVQYGSVHKF